MLVGFFAAGLIVLPITIAFFSPLLLICLALSTGALPLALGSDGLMATDFGRLDLYSIRVFGLWLASILLILPSFSRLLEYGTRFRWHATFLAFAVAAMIWSPSMLYGARMVAKLTAPFLFLLMVLVCVSSFTALRSMERAIFFSGALAIVLSLGAVLAGYTSVSSMVGLGIPGLGPAGTSAHLAIITMLALSAARVRPAAAVYAVITLCFGAAVIAGFTRITIAGLLLGITAVLWVSGSGWFRWVLPLAGAGSLPALFVFNDTFRRRMFKSEQGMSLDQLTSDPSAALDQIHGSGRFDHWAYVMKTFFDPHPLFGSGVGTTQHYFYTHQLGLSVIHSEYVRLLAEVGIIGTGLLVFAFAAYILRLRRTYRLAQHDQTKTYALAGIGALVVYIIFMATDNAIDYVTSSGIYVFTLVAMSEKARELEAAEPLAEPIDPAPDEPELLPGTPPRRYPILAWK